MKRAALLRRSNLQPATSVAMCDLLDLIAAIVAIIAAIRAWPPPLIWLLPMTRDKRRFGKSNRSASRLPMQERVRKSSKIPQECT
jgi:hypothetical protein